ncbi:GNAT family N-acetyltransferase [Peristeroidobacter agariperforans]|uniref:GNAT family N-acetyltransferase n=1 Tax=Peristeroidobacter agariperforans TaxID=268404 RepID=UPI00101C3698|nr:GNAT family N-acetyltransferase [Peristeroidobacter agariperforans]
MLAGIEISTDKARIDVELVHRFLSTSYWATGRSRQTVERSILHSLCFGAYKNAQQVGFGRAITDRAVFAYIADVFVVPEHRGAGIGKALIGAMLAHPDLAGLQVVLLRTRDAAGLYSQFGFQALRRPEEVMGRYSSAP